MLRLCCWQERPCARCLKRNIGHLCHDEPREPVKKSHHDSSLTPADEEQSLKQEDFSVAMILPPIHQQQADQQGLEESELRIEELPPSTAKESEISQSAQRSSVPGPQATAIDAESKQCEY